jgi:hypothetical protein
MAPRTLTCRVCQNTIDRSQRFVVMRGRREDAFCSAVCLMADVESRHRVRAAVHRRWLLAAAVVLAVVVGAPRLWHRLRLPRSRTIAFEPPEVRPAAPPRPQPTFYGPAWPPTDEDWLTAFDSTPWTYPLPGPERRVPAGDDHLLAARLSTRKQPPACRTADRCGVDLGGGLWGEHVYAVHDGVVDHIQHGSGEERADVYLRVAHFGGMVFTHYFHLAAVPRNIVRGAVVKAGEVIGLVGDMGDEHPSAANNRYIHFALSVRPSPDLPEVYWDPTPLMEHWPMRVPPHGTVAGFLPSESDLILPPAFHHHAR